MASITDWLTAVGTVGAFGVALYLLGSQMRDRRRERIYGQAYSVATWIDELRSPEPQKDAPQSEFWKVTIVVQNSSNWPVYNVSVRLPVGVRGTFVRSPGTLGPGESRELFILLPSPPRGELRAEMLFTDRYDTLWIRYSATGKLKRIKISSILNRSKIFSDFLQQDAGAYPSAQDHPTLSLDSPPYDQHGQRRK